MAWAPDGSERDFFRFIDEYRELIQRRIPGNFIYEYDFKPYMVPVHRHLEKLVSELPRGARVLDLGCGRGHFGAYLSARGLKVEGLEVLKPRRHDDLFFNQDASSIGRYKSLWAEARKRYGAAMRHYDGLKMPFKSGFFDAVLFYASFEHVPVEHIALVAAESSRVLKGGGKAYIFRCPSSLAWTEAVAGWFGLAHEKLYGKAEISGLLEGAGYRVAEFSRSDFFPSHFKPLQGLLNRSTHAMLALEGLLRFTPLNWLFHHFEITAVKKAGA